MMNNQPNEGLAIIQNEMKQIQEDTLSMMENALTYWKDWSGWLTRYRELDRHDRKAVADLCRSAFKKGCILREVIGCGELYGNGVVGKFALELGVSVSTLYRDHQIARRFMYDETLLEAWISLREVRNEVPSIRRLLKTLADDNEKTQSLGGRMAEKPTPIPDGGWEICSDSSPSRCPTCGCEIAGR